MLSLLCIRRSALHCSVVSHNTCVSLVPYVCVQTPFKTYMKLVGQQYSGREVIGRNIWLFRFDKETTTAAGIAAGAGVWVEAQVVGYNEKSGEHEVRQQYVIYD